MVKDESESAFKPSLTPHGSQGWRGHMVRVVISQLRVSWRSVCCRCEEVKQLSKEELEACGSSISQRYDNEFIRYADLVFGGLAQLTVLTDSSNCLFAGLIWRFRKCQCYMMSVRRAWCNKQQVSCDVIYVTADYPACLHVPVVRGRSSFCSHLFCSGSNSTNIRNFIWTLCHLYRNRLENPSFHTRQEVVHVTHKLSSSVWGCLAPLQLISAGQAEHERQLQSLNGVELAGGADSGGADSGVQTQVCWRAV